MSDQETDLAPAAPEAGVSGTFTPGPWEIEARANNAYAIIGPVEDGAVRGRKTVCALNVVFTPAPRKVNKANAYLIAAAPDQHEALSDAEVALTALINRYGYEDDNITPKDWSEWVFARHARDAARAALSKALGAPR